MKKVNPLLLGVELEVEILADPNPFATHTSTYVIYGSYPKHNNLGHIHKRHGDIVAAADEVAKDKIETHYDNTINDGVEWIGKPMSLIENKEVWEALLEDERVAPYIHGEDVNETPGNGYGIHDVGMHVHVSSANIDPLLMGKLMVFVNSTKNKPFIEFIAGRKLNKFCDTQPTRKVEDGELLYHTSECLKVSKRNKRIASLVNGSFDVFTPSGLYCCDNAIKFSGANFTRGAIWVAPLYGTGDFEIRIFKSTVKPSRFNANLEFVAALVEFCRQVDLERLNYKEFSGWMSRLEQRLKYTYLFKLMRKSGYTQGIIPKRETIDEWIRSGRLKLEDLEGVAA